MAVVDLLVLAAVVVGVTLGALRGFVPQVTGVFGLGGGLYLASRYHIVVREHLIDPRSEWAYNGELAFVGIIVGSVLLAAFAGWGLRKLMEVAGLATYDRIMGGALGAAKAAGTACLVLLAIVYVAPDGGGLERAIGESRSGPALWNAMDQVAESLPDDVGDRMELFLDDHALPGRPAMREVAPVEFDFNDATIHYFDDPFRGGDIQDGHVPGGIAPDGPDGPDGNGSAEGGSAGDGSTGEPPLRVDE